MPTKFDSIKTARIFASTAVVWRKKIEGEKWKILFGHLTNISK
jgi:hypothetical protein